jgi:hypothetical protein
MHALQLAQRVVCLLAWVKLGSLHGTAVAHALYRNNEHLEPDLGIQLGSPACVDVDIHGEENKYLISVCTPCTVSIPCRPAN